MTPETILKKAERAGVSITLSQPDSIKASGKQKRVNQLLPVIRNNKAELIRFLQQPPVEPDLKPCPICKGIDFVHGDKGGYYCTVCQPDARSGVFVGAGGNRSKTG